MAMVWFASIMITFVVTAFIMVVARAITNLITRG